MKYKIMHIITRLDKGGSAENVLMSCKKIDKNRFDVILVYGLTNFPIHDIDFRRFEIKELVRNFNPIKDLIAFIKILWIILKEKPDIVHTHSSKAGFIGRLSAWIIGIRNIVHTPHGHIFYGYEFNAIQRFLYLKIEQISAKITKYLIALTEGEKQESLNLGIGKPLQWTVIHSGVELPNPNTNFITKNDIRKDLKLSENAIVIGTVARLEPVKGVRYLIEAASLLLNKYKKEFESQNIIFLIIGDGSERKNLESLSKKLNIANNCIFTGFRDDCNLLMRAMDIYVQPSLNEGMGKTLIQAQSVSLPIVASKVQGIPYVIKDMETGFLIPPKDSEAISRAILILIKDKELRKKMGEAGKEFVYSSKDKNGLPRFSIENMIFLLEKLYDKMLNL